MNRSGGVTASAILVFLGSALILICAAFMILGLFLMSTRESQPRFMLYFMVVMVAVMFGASGWGIATGVGLINLRSWARTSMLIFGGILLFFTLPGLAMIPFIPLAPQNDLPSKAILGIRVFMSVFYGGVASLGGWWLYFFNKNAVKVQFAGGATQAVLPAGGGARPLSIAVIGWLYLVCSCLALPALLFPIPVVFMGFWLTGFPARVVLLSSSVAGIIMAVGLLKLKPWGRMLAICYFLFFIFQGIISLVLPGSQARYDQAMASFQASVGLPQTPLHFPIWVASLIGLPVILVALWFVITRKQAFMDSVNGPAPL